jgi:hypothetical protein
MPRPARKPKKFKPEEPQGAQNGEVDVPVVSTPLHPSLSAANPIMSPGLSPIQPTNDFAGNSNDEGGKTVKPEFDEFGFGKIKGVKKPISATQLDFDADDEADFHDIDDDNPEDDDDIYGEPYAPPAEENDLSLSAQAESSPVAVPPPKPKVRKVRTSQLLPLLPARRKRQSRHPQKKQVTPNTSDAESEQEDIVKSKPVKKRRVVDKENDVPDVSENDNSEEERAMEERRKIIKKKFAEVDQWEMAFETVDLSFSSQ